MKPYISQSNQSTLLVLPMFTWYIIFYFCYCLHDIKYLFSFSQNIYQHQIQIQMHKNNQILNGKKWIKSINQFNIHIQNQRNNA